MEENVKRCVECGHRGLERAEEQLAFNEVALVEGVVYTCPECGERYEGLRKVEELSRAVAHHIARAVERLSPAEIRYLRKYLGYSSTDFAEFLGVALETVSRWESKTSPKPMKLSTEKLLRFMALHDQPISDYGLDEAGTQKKRSPPPLFRNRGGSWVAA